MSVARYTATEGSLDGAMTILLRDRVAGLAATIVPGVGSNLISLAAPDAGVEFLYRPPSLDALRSRPTRYGNPVLMPPNRIRGGEFTFAGRRYRLPVNRPPHHIHGLVLDLSWRVTGYGGGEDRAWLGTVMEAGEHPSFQAVFPQRFRLSLLFVLQDGALCVTAEAANGGPDPFPFGLGYHTYFQLPAARRLNREGYRLSLPATRAWELDGDCLPTGRILDLAAEERLDGAAASDLRLDRPYTGLRPVDGEYRARLWHEGSGIGLELASDPTFPHWVVWSGPEPGSPFLCLEPYSCITDAPNLPLPAEVTGLAALAPGGTWRGRVMFRPFGLAGREEGCPGAMGKTRLSGS